MLYGLTADLFGNRTTATSLEKEKDLNSYRFTLAFENSMEEEDYDVTEKYWDALSSLSIPVVFGAPNIHDYEKSIYMLKIFKIYDIWQKQ